MIGKHYKLYVTDDLVLERDMKKQFFWTAAIYHSGKDDKEAEVVLAPHAGLYSSEAKARKKAIKAIPTKFKERFDRLEVIVCPF